MFKILSYPFLVIGVLFVTIAICIRCKFNTEKIKKGLQTLEEKLGANI
jgi:hypothetical protein